MARSRPPSAIRNPLTHIFGVDSNVAALRELLRHGGAMASSDIQRRSGLSKSSVRLALLSLESSQIITSEGNTTTRLYRFNADYVLAPQISALFEAEAQRFGTILDTIRSCGRDLGTELHSLWIYGSVARREDTIESDLDIAVIADRRSLTSVVERLRRDLREPARRLGFLPNIVGLDPQDVQRLARDNDPLWHGMIADTILLLGRTPDAMTIPERKIANG